MKPATFWKILAIISWLITAIVIYLWLFLPDLEAGQEPDWDKLVPIIIQIESGGNPSAVSKAGCIGLMQISPIVLKEYIEIILPLALKTNDLYYIRSITDLNEGSLYNSQINVKIGTWYLKRIWFHYLTHYDIPQTIDNLLIAYNWGIGNVVKWHKAGAKWNKLPKETQRYIQLYHKYEKIPLACLY